MNTTLSIIQIILSIGLVISILLQVNESGLGGAFGGDDSGTPAHTRRGFEKTLFKTTIVLAIAFIIVSFIVFALS